MLAAEIGGSFINGLPDPSVMRYGRPLGYGPAAYATATGALSACSETPAGLAGVPGKTCTFDGYMSKTAWGVRGRIAATYYVAAAGANLTPSLTVAKDIAGYSYDGTFSEGRLTWRAALRADWGKRFYGEVSYTGMGGGNYNLMADRSNLGLVAGWNF